MYSNKSCLVKYFYTKTMIKYYINVGIYVYCKTVWFKLYLMAWLERQNTTIRNTFIIDVMFDWQYNVLLLYCLDSLSVYNDFHNIKWIGINIQHNLSMRQLKISLYTCVYILKIKYLIQFNFVYTIFFKFVISYSHFRKLIL